MKPSLANLAGLVGLVAGAFLGLGSAQAGLPSPNPGTSSPGRGAATQIDPTLVTTTELEASHASGDLAPIWLEQLGVEGTELMTFRWKSSGFHTAKGDWELRDPSDALLLQGTSSSAADAEGYRTFTIPLDTVAAAPPFTVTIQPLTATDQIAAALSNPVVLDPAEPSETCFTDAGLGLPIHDPLSAIAASHQVPALGGAIVTKSGLAVFDAVGVRSVDSQVPVTKYDKWHMGSITKSMTGTLAVVLTQKYPQLLDEGTTIGEAFQDEPWAGELDPVFAGITLRDLMAHRSGISVVPTVAADVLVDANLPVTDRRKEFTRVLGQNPPWHPIGWAYEYRNENMVIAGAMLEAIFGQAWEQLIEQHLFAPLHMTETGFGTGALDGVSQPAGHMGDAYGAIVENQGDNDPSLGPAGTVHTTLVDLAKYIRLYLNLTEGQLTLSQDSFDELTAPYTESYGERYSWGWGNGLFDGKVVLGHDGSNTLWYASISVAPEDGYGLIAVSNIATVDTYLEDEDYGDMRGQKAVHETMAMLYEHQTGCPDEGRAQVGGAVLGGSPGSSLDPSPGPGAGAARARKLGSPAPKETLRKRTIGVKSPARSSRLRVVR